MAGRPSETAPRRADPLIETLARGRPFPQGAQQLLSSFLGTAVGREGLGRLFQPGLPGVRVYVIQTHATHLASVEMTMVGVSRDGVPVWVGPRSFSRNASGAVEIHHGYQEVAPDFRSRNLIVDSLRREIDLLRVTSRGAARITADADGVGKYICALHGFVFADETEEGPPAASPRAHDPVHDRERLLAAAPAFIRRFGKRHSASEAAIEAAIGRMMRATSPAEIAQQELDGVNLPVPAGEAGLAGGLGRAFLLADDTPGWRAALYPDGPDKASTRAGEAYRQQQTADSEARLADEITRARELLQNPQRGARIRALQTLGQIAASWVLPEVKALVAEPDRRVAAVARQTVAQITGTDLAERILAFAEDRQHDPHLRGLAYRVIAEYFMGRLESRLSMLRVDPDARIQRACLPAVVQSPSEAGPELASMLAANPWSDGPRPGLIDLRVEIIDRLTILADARALPALMAAIAAEPPPEELLALSRALLASPDPRARVALSAATQRMERPLIP